MVVELVTMVAEIVTMLAELVTMAPAELATVVDQSRKIWMIDQNDAAENTACNRPENDDELPAGPTRVSTVCMQKALETCTIQAGIYGAGSSFELCQMLF